MRFRCGIDNPDLEGKLKGLTVRLVSSSTGFSLDGRPSYEKLAGMCHLKGLLAPEHGFFGSSDAGEDVDSYIDPVSGLEVRSLYSSKSQEIPDSAFSDIDAVVYDIQDVGVRCYTYISTLLLLMKKASQLHKAVMILDRPNPLGRRLDGPVLEGGFESFVGCYSLPLRYGLTPGEFALLARKELGLTCELEIVCCLDWDPSLLFSDYQRAWVMSSPAIPGFENALSYSGFCLLEAANLSEGRGTGRPFLLFGAPWIDARKLTEKLNSKSLGVLFCPAWFTPSASKFKDLPCQGSQILIEDQHAFLGVKACLETLRTVRDMYPQFTLLDEGKKLHRLLGGPWGLDDELPSSYDYDRRRQEALLYKESI